MRILVALAVKNGRWLVTFDCASAGRAVKAARAEHLGVVS